MYISSVKNGQNTRKKYRVPANTYKHRQHKYLQDTKTRFILASDMDLI